MLNNMKQSVSIFIFHIFLTSIFKTKRKNIPDKLLYALPDPRFCQPASKLAFIFAFVLQESKCDWKSVNSFHDMKENI